ncbi:MAG: hypothetical protein JSV36_11975 [Anaerolineae bacterium]|nr:MAG: hypothetical protein JSV36_11975 [Anaerolineae bacterium]
MNWKQIFDLRGTNLWLIGASVGWNVIWTFVTLFVAYRALGGDESAVSVVQLALMLSEFAGPFLCGWLTGRLAADGRGPTYGVVGSLSSVVLILIVLLPSGILGFLVAVVALAGGLNGGLLSQSRRARY